MKKDYTFAVSFSVTQTELANLSEALAKTASQLESVLPNAYNLSITTLCESASQTTPSAEAA